MVVFPNYAARMENGSVMLELSHALLCDPLTGHISQIIVAAQVDATESSGTYRTLSNPRVRFVSLGERREPPGLVSKFFEYVRLVPRVGRTIGQSRFCYIFAPGNVGLVAWWCCLMMRCPYALYLRGDWGTGTPRIFRWLHRFIVRRARFVLSTGYELANETRRFNPRSEAVVPMSEVLTLETPPAGPAARGEVGRLLFVGQLIREKGVYELIDAFKIAQDSGFPVAKLTMVGAGQELTDLRGYAERAGVAESILFSGLIDDPEELAAVYEANDVFCLPTYHEGFPRVIYEAMWFRLPVIVTRVGQIDSVVQDGINGLFVRTRDSQDLARSICTLLRDSELRLRLGQNARATVEPMVSEWRKSNHGSQVLRWMRSEGLVGSR